MRNIICLLILSLSWLHGSAQLKYFGAILDKETKKPLANISVTVIIKKDTIKTKTNIDGQYSFQTIPCKELRLNIRSRDYRPYDISIKFAKQRLKGPCQIENIILTRTYMNTTFNRAFAIGNIANNNMFVLLPGGIAGSEIFDSDTTFEYKYKVTYQSNGCVFSFDDNETEYNLTIFEYLDKTYGNSWRKEIRQDAIGLK